jgi:hypothetical protein
MQEPEAEAATVPVQHPHAEQVAGLLAERQPTVRLPRPPRVSSATAWWIAVGVIVVALAVAAGILVGLHLARRGPADAAGATCDGRPAPHLAAGSQFAPDTTGAAKDTTTTGAAKDTAAGRDGCGRAPVTGLAAPG